LNYKQARKRRVAQLEQQRQKFLGKDNVLPCLATLPNNLTPFGSDRFTSEVTWANHSNLSLFPAPLDLAALDQEQAIALRTWFVAHVAIAPRKATRKQPKPPSATTQLTLL
jgi:deoxyribodipyrimidine photo-lyase